MRMERKQQNDYDALAPFYDLLGHFAYAGRILKSQQHYLSIIPRNARILFIGGGSGRILNELIETADPDQIWYVEKSEGMIRRARAGLNPGYRNQVHFLHGTQDNLPAEQVFDVVLSFYFFDQFSFMTLCRIFSRINRQLRVGGLWLWADFIPPKNGWQTLMLNAMLVFFRLTTNLGTRRIYDVPGILLRRGFRIDRQADFFGGFIRSAVLVKEQKWD